MILTLPITYTDVEFLNESVDNYSCVTVCQSHDFKRKPVLSGLNQVIVNIFEFSFIIKREFVPVYLIRIYACYIFSIGDIFPSVSLNFAGGASMVLKQEQYLTHSGFVVSMFVTLLVIFFGIYATNNTLTCHFALTGW